MTAISVILVISIAVFLPPKKNHRNGDAMTEIEMNDLSLSRQWLLWISFSLIGFVSQKRIGLLTDFN